MTDEHEHDPAVPDAPAAEGAAADDVEAAADDPRPDPRLRPPDPAGTQPKWDPEELLPKATPRAAAGRLWAPEAEGAERHDADRETVAPTGAPVAAAAPSAEAGGEEPRHSPYSARFQFLLGALLATGAAAVVLLVAALVGGGQSNDSTIALRSGPKWSDWQPKAAGGLPAAEEIAEHVARKYELPNGQQLVGVTATAMEYGGLPVTIAIERPVAAGGIDYLDGTPVWFHMCDVNATDKDHCAIAYGKPSPSRHLLLRREALELALYSFRYLGVSDVVVSLPPAQSAGVSASGKTVVKTTDQALLFRRDQSDVRSALDHQLTHTLSREVPSVSTVTRWPDARAVKTLTNTRVFKFRLQPGNSEPRAFLVLSPLPVR